MVKQAASPARILIASLVGTTIEFFDFYIFATAAVLVFPHLYFPTSDPASAVLQSFATFSIAFFARPLGAAVFGHYGDRIGRKATLVAALMTMGLSTVLIGLLPGYDTIGVLAPLLLALCRFGQGLGLGGEWGGAVLLATENAPPHRRSWYAMFPQLGAPLGFVLSASSFLLLTETLTNAQFLAWGWRVPFVASLLLVLLGLYVRLNITETPQFQKVVDTKSRVAVPLMVLLRSHKRALLLGTLVALATFVLFYLMTVFSLSWATGKLGISRERYLEIQLIGVVFFAATIPLAARLADRYGRRVVLLLATAGTAVFGLFFETLLAGGLGGALVFNIVGLALMGFNYGPIGAALASPFPVSVRYTGASMTFNLAGIFGASLAPYIATWLALNFSLAWVGYYLIAACLLTLTAMLISRDDELSS